MFTGIVEEMGRVQRLRPNQNGIWLDIQAEHVVADLQVGASIAINGVCQTVLEHGATGFTVAAEMETLRLTNLSRLQPNDPVNLERAVPAAGRLDGHLVLGHVDGHCEVVSARREQRTVVLRLKIEESLRPYVVGKGCIAIDGVSLTVGPDVVDGEFDVFVIPYTSEHTTLGLCKAGDRVNVETDIWGRYVVQALERRQSGASNSPTEGRRDPVSRVMGAGFPPGEST